MTDAKDSPSHRRRRLLAPVLLTLLLTVLLHLHDRSGDTTAYPDNTTDTAAAAATGIAAKRDAGQAKAASQNQQTQSATTGSRGRHCAAVGTCHHGSAASGGTKH